MNAMRTIIFVCLLAVAVPFAGTGCNSAPSQRVVAIQTLKAVGESAEAAVALSAQLYRDGKITATQARMVMDTFDNKFQPAFRFAVATAHADLSSVASPDLIALASQLISLVSSFQKPST